MTIRTAVLFAASLLLAGMTAFAPASAQNLGDPSSLNARAPDTYKARFETSKGTFVIQVNRDWAPNGADRFYNLVKAGFYNDARFFRVIDGFMVQFGISGNPDVSAAWSDANIKDDPVRESNARGTVTFATAGPNTRTTQVFINFNNNSMLNGQGFAPFGKVISGMDVVDSLYKGYGEGAPRGDGPKQALIKAQGNAYLVTQFPKLDYIKKATIE
ncbi:peptidylprolyl isomerase [Methyloceanibacter sp.]|uniref:peptidylprolyl isomerase n=1 Tax=Methyloceanibacter sp. TaxID=1965321 RepID=UPI002C285E7B|nr:peptidylprolyl isomerase [Methyloceanibacter sp.]HML93451.1 peptidylprolyl isomerase [Methyloceanibacter sp.]